MNILHIAPDFDINSGITKYLLNLFTFFKNNNEYKFFFMTNGGNALYKLDELEVNYEIIPFSRGLKNILYISRNEKDVIEYCKKNNICIIHSHHRYPELVANNVKKTINVKTIATAHSVVSGYSKYSFKSDKIIAVSKAVYSIIIKEFNVPEEKVEVLYNCSFPISIPKVDINHERRLLGIKPEDNVFLFVGRGTKLKGADTLIHSFNAIVKDNQNSFLIMIADHFEKSILEMINSPNIKLIVPQENIYKYYMIANAVVLPSLEESFSYVKIESGFMKKCLIASNIGGLNEYLDNESALLVNPNDEKSLISRMEYVINNKTEIDKIGRNLYDKVFPLTNCQEYYSKLKTIYNNLVTINV